MNKALGKTTVNILLKICREKVITETDLLKSAFGNVGRLSESYQTLVSMGFPIRRKEIESIKTGRKGGKARADHRVVIYYLE